MRAAAAAGRPARRAISQLRKTEGRPLTLLQIRCAGAVGIACSEAALRCRAILRSGPDAAHRDAHAPDPVRGPGRCQRGGMRRLDGQELLLQRGFALSETASSQAEAACSGKRLIRSRHSRTDCWEAPRCSAVSAAMAWDTAANGAVPQP